MRSDALLLCLRAIRSPKTAHELGPQRRVPVQPREARSMLVEGRLLSSSPLHLLLSHPSPRPLIPNTHRPSGGFVPLLNLSAPLLKMWPRRVSDDGLPQTNSRERSQHHSPPHLTASPKVLRRELYAQSLHCTSCATKNFRYIPLTAVLSN